MALPFDRAVYRGEPTPEDVLAANAQIRQHEHSIISIHARITSLVSEVAQLRVEEAHHQDAIRACKGVTTLARRIPDELLAQIFEHCVADGWTLAPVVVSTVCSAWHRAARTPGIWSHVHVSCSSTDTLARTRYWLRMARAAPLDVTLLCVWTPAWRLEEVMDLLLQHSARWRTLTIESTSLEQVNIILSRIPLARASVPALREVSFDTEFHFDEPDEHRATDIEGLSEALSVAAAPHLTVLRYTANVLPRAPIFPAHIQHLTLTATQSPLPRPLSTPELLRVLAGVPRLRSLTLSMLLDGERFPVPTPATERTVVLPLLVSMTLYGPTDLNGVLAHIRAPRIRRLHLRSLEDDGYCQQPIAPSLLHFFERSSLASFDEPDLSALLLDTGNPPPVLSGAPGETDEAEGAPPLELLELHDIDLSSEAFAAAFHALPHLRELRLHEGSLSDGTLQFLHGPHGLCPRLARLDLRWCGHLSGRALVELVRSRLPAGPTNVASAEVGFEVTDPAADRDGDGSASAGADPIEEVAVINCCFVEEHDVLALAQTTTCRVVMRDADDYCRTRDCCGNVRYRTRLRLKHMVGMSVEERARMRLVV